MSAEVPPQPDGEEQPEAQPPYFERREDLPHVKFLLDLTREEKEALRRRVQHFNGVVQVFVHPFYHLNEPNPISTKIENAVKTRSEMPAEKIPPIIVFLEYTTPEHLEFFKNAQQDIYVVLTGHEMGTPWIGEEQRQELDVEGYNKLAKIKTKIMVTMKDVQIQAVVLAGISLDVFERSTDNKIMRFGQCVGEVAHFLKRHFKITFSDLIVGRIGRSKTAREEFEEKGTERSRTVWRQLKSRYKRKK